MSAILKPSLQHVVLNYGLHAPEGPKGLFYTLDFSVNTSYDFDLTQEQRAGMLDFCTTMWLDNTGAGASRLSVIVPQSQQTVHLLAKQQGYLPIMFGSDLKCTIITDLAGANNVVQVGFLNFDAGPLIWQGVP